MHFNSAELPAFSVLHAKPGWRRIDFISDLHLSSATPKTFDAFGSYLTATPADAVMILGDLFDVWIGDDARHDDFERQCADLLAEAASRRRLYFMAGNRDFLLGAEMLDRCGVQALADPTLLAAFGRRALLTHGDRLCLDDDGYQRFRAVVRQSDWQRRFLQRPLADRREEARRLRGESREAQSRTDAAASSVDLDRQATLGWMQESGADLLIHGHTHRPQSERLLGDRWRHVLSDWDLDRPPPRAEVLCWEASGLRRLQPQAACAGD